MNTDTTPTPSYELEKGICKSKVDSLLCDPDRKVTGYFLTKEDGSVCMVDKGAVRWITKEEWWWIFHESNQYPKESQLSDRDHNEVARLREELKERIETQNTFALALLEKPERDVARLREIVERYRVWATSENPTQMELDNLKQKYDELN